MRNARSLIDSLKNLSFILLLALIAWIGISLYNTGHLPFYFYMGCLCY